MKYTCVYFKGFRSCLKINSKADKNARDRVKLVSK